MNCNTESFIRKFFKFKIAIDKTNNSIILCEVFKKNLVKIIFKKERIKGNIYKYTFFSINKSKFNGVKMNGICPNCDEIVQLSNTIKRNGLFDCPICGEPLKVKKLIPLELEYDMSEYDYDEEDKSEYENN